MSGITPEIIERVRAETNIVDVIGDYVRLRRTGKNWLGLCPFHDDRNPSMNVEPVRGIFKCFSCGKGGDAFTFLMELNGWTFPETVRNLAASLGIEIVDDPKERDQLGERERLAEAVTEAARFYNRTLRSESGTAGLGYLRSRGLTDETITRYGLGYAPDDWEVLLTALREKGFTAEEVERAGLSIKREGRKGWYDRFRGRTVFPIFSGTGRVVGFGARRMSEDASQPKYLNSPETPLYQKSRVLYGLFQAKETIRKRGLALIVEGYLDVLSLHQHGVACAVAPCGTALATEHADLLSRYTSRVVLTFDSDKAGSTATDRGIDVLLGKGLDVAVVRLPDGEDPDTFVRKYGAEEFERRLADAVSFLDYRARQMKSAGDFDHPERQSQAIRSIVGSIAVIPDQLKRQLYLQKLAADFFLPETVLHAELERQRGEAESRGRVSARRVEARAAIAEREAGDAPVEPAPADGDETPKTALTRPEPPAPPPADEALLLRVMTQGDVQLLEHIFMHIAVEDFQHPATRALLERIIGNYGAGRPFTLDALLAEEMPPELRDFTITLAFERESTSDHWARFGDDIGDPNPWRIARDCIRQIQHDRAVREFRMLQERLLSVSGEEQREVMVQLAALGQQINSYNRMRAGQPQPES